jgi:hypothetical protein
MHDIHNIFNPTTTSNMSIIYNKQAFINIISQMISLMFCYCQVDNVARIMHLTSMFAQLQCPRVLAGRNIIS